MEWASDWDRFIAAPLLHGPANVVAALCANSALAPWMPSARAAWRLGHGAALVENWRRQGYAVACTPAGTVVTHGREQRTVSRIDPTQSASTP